MKKLLSFLILLTTVLSSCEQAEISNNNNKEDGNNLENVQCKFKAVKSLPDGEESPMRASAPRKIIYRFESTNPYDLVEGTVLENNTLYVDLKRGYTYKAKFFYAEDIKNDIVTVKDEHVYGFSKVYTVTDSISETITLTREIGKFTAKAGKIPSEAEVEVDIRSYRQFNWFTSAINYDLDNPHAYFNIIAKLNTGESCWTYGIPDTNKTVLVTVAIIKNGNVIKRGNYEYNVKANTNHTVTYNINNVGSEGSEFGEHDITIDETWSEVSLDDNQQVG